MFSANRTANRPQTLFAEAPGIPTIIAWFKMYAPDAQIHDICAATAAHEAPGKPCIVIERSYEPYTSAARCISLILERQKTMTCRFYVMDEGYLQSLTYPALAVDNHGTPLRVDNWYVIVTRENGYKYYINVTSDSVVTMCAEVFNFIQCK